MDPAFIKLTGMPYPIGKTATELLGSPNPRWTEHYGMALDTGRPLRLEETEHTLGRVFDLNIFTSTFNATVSPLSSPTSRSGGAQGPLWAKAKRIADRCLKRRVRVTA